MSLQKWLLDRRVNKEQGDIQTLESYKGYNVGDSIYFSDADKKMKLINSCDILKLKVSLHKKMRQCNFLKLFS